MKVKLASDYGFCYGVKQSIAKAEANRGSVIVGGEIIHNPEETSRLKQDFNIGIENDPNNIKKGQTAIIRAHGIPEQVEQQLRERGVVLIDATCPNVKDVQLRVKELSTKGYQIILLGDKAHPETQGIMGYTQNGIIVVKDSSELDALIPKLTGDIAMLSQTTKNFNTLQGISKWVNDRITPDVKNCVLCNTICPATALKQKSAQDLAGQVDVGVVVGGKNSSNTKLLKDIMGEFCPTYLVERPGELDLSWFKGKKICGLTSGSSTPDYSIQSVKREIEAI